MTTIRNLQRALERCKARPVPRAIGRSQTLLQVHPDYNPERSRRVLMLPVYLDELERGPAFMTRRTPAADPLDFRVREKRFYLHPGGPFVWKSDRRTARKYRLQPGEVVAGSWEWALLPVTPRSPLGGFCLTGPRAIQVGRIERVRDGGGLRGKRLAEWAEQRVKLYRFVPRFPDGAPSWVLDPERAIMARARRTGR